MLFLKRTFQIVALAALVSVSAHAQQDSARLTEPQLDVRIDSLAEQQSEQRVSDIARSLETLERLRQLADDYSYLPGILTYARLVIQNRFNIADPQAYISQLTEYEQAFEGRLSSSQKGTLHIALAAMHMESTQFDEVLNLLEPLLARIDAVVEAADQPYIRNIAAETYLETGRMDKATDLYLEMLADPLVQQDAGLLANTFNGLGNAAYYAEQFEEATSYYKRALPLYKENGSNSGILVATNNLASTYRTMDSLQVSLRDSEEMLPLIEGHANTEEQAQYFLNRGNVHTDLAEYAEARRYMRRSLELSKAGGISFGIALNYLNLGSNYLHDKRFLAAEAYLDSTAAMLETLDLPYFERRLYQRYAALYKDTGRYDEAFQAQETAHAIDRTLMDTELRSRTEEIETRYETALKDAEIEEQEQQLLAKNMRLRLMYLIIAMSLLGLGGALLFFRHRQENMRQLYQRNKEIMMEEALASAKSRQKLIPLPQAEQQAGGQVQAGRLPDNAGAPEEHEETLRQVFGRIMDLIRSEHIYRDSSITLEALSSRLHTNSTYVYKAINTCSNMNFNAFINYHRIVEARRRLYEQANTAHAQPAGVDEIYESCGFNSRSSFYRAFKRFVGMSPGQFMKEARKEETADAKNRS
ncbi:MAG: helix-turn-helix domain-containing protein [Cyclonatronaceae bacterium]